MKVIEEAFLAVMAKEPARQEALRVQREADRSRQQAAARALAEEDKRREEKRHDQSLLSWHDWQLVSTASSS